MSALHIDVFCSVFSMLQGYLPFVFRANEQPTNGPAAPEPPIDEGNEFEATDQPITSDLSPVDHSDMQAAASETEEEEDNSSGSATATASQEAISNTTDQCILRTSFRDNPDQDTAEPCIDIGRRLRGTTYVFNGPHSDYYMVKISLNDLEAEWLNQDDSEYYVGPPAAQEIELYAEVDVIRFTLNRIEWLDDPMAHSSDEDEGV